MSLEQLPLATPPAQIARVARNATTLGRRVVVAGPARKSAAALVRLPRLETLGLQELRQPKQGKRPQSSWQKI